MEELKACDKTWHKQCFKCVHCGMVLSMKNFAAIEGDPYCKPHFIELFKQKGSYATFKEGDEAKSNSYNPITSFQGLHAGAPGGAGERKSYFPAQPKSPRLHVESSPKAPSPTPTPTPTPAATTPSPAVAVVPPKKEEPKKEEPKKEEPKKEPAKPAVTTPTAPVDNKPPRPTTATPNLTSEDTKEKRNSGSNQTPAAEPEKVPIDKRTSLPPPKAVEELKVDKRISLPPAQQKAVDDTATINKAPKLEKRSGSAQALITEEPKPAPTHAIPYIPPLGGMQKRPSVLEREFKDTRIKGVVTKVETLQTGKWLAFKKIQYSDPSRKSREWESVERTTRGKTTFTDAVCLLAIVQYHTTKKDPHVVIVKQFRPALNKICLEMPAGLLNDGESEEQAALRELNEETGYTGKVMGVTSTSATDPGLTNASCALVTVEIDGDDPQNANPKPHLDEGEFVSVDLIPLNTLYGTLQDLSEEYAIDSRLLSIAVGMNTAINQSILPSIQD